MSPARVVDLPSVDIDWPNTCRITTERPPISLFELTDDPEELEILQAQLGAADAIDLGRVPSPRRISGPGTSAVMGCFVYPGESRFSDSGFGVYYAARRLKGAVAEVGYHLARMLRERRAPSVTIERQLLRARVKGELHRLVGAESAWPGVDSAIENDYAVSRRLGAALHAADSRGLVYTSVRRPPEECVAVFDPRCVGPTRSGGTVRFDYDADAGTVIGAALVRPLSG